MNAQEIGVWFAQKVERQKRINAHEICANALARITKKEELEWQKKKVFVVAWSHLWMTPAELERRAKYTITQTQATNIKNGNLFS